MAMGSSWKALLAAVAFLAVLEVGLVSANFSDQCNITWGAPDNAEISDYGNHLKLFLRDNSSGAMVETLKPFIYGSVSTMIKLIEGDSAGSVTTYYTCSDGDFSVHDEIDYEFLGNSSGNPYTIHTNVFADGVGKREMQFKPWFDPTTDYHNYTIFWNPCMIVWYVDSYPIRVFRNHTGLPFPTQRPMYAYSSIWNADDWATQGGRVKANWTLAPFVSEYRDIDLKVCECADGADDKACATTCAKSKYAAEEPCKLTDKEKKEMDAIQLGYTIYDYCVNAKDKAAKDPENAKPVPPECYLEQY
uniref:Uncharacterized protein n=1 Tax=Avena sativa TaxID=4498 RepID=A0ACD6AHP1_AVESA